MDCNRTKMTVTTRSQTKKLRTQCEPQGLKLSANQEEILEGEANMRALCNCAEPIKIANFREPHYGFGIAVSMTNPSKNVYCHMDDDADYSYIGADITAYDIEDKLIDKMVLIGAEYIETDINEEDIYLGDLYVQVITNRGILQIKFYHYRDGYYPLKVKVQDEDGIREIMA